MTFALLLLLTAYTQVGVIDEHFEIPAGDWRYVPRPLTEEPAMVACLFQADRADARVRMILLSHDDLNAWRAGRDHDETAATPVGAQGALRISIHDADTYVAIENRTSRPVNVRLRVLLEQPRVRTLSRGRQLAVILISFGVFFAIASLSARKLLKAIRK